MEDCDTASTDLEGATSWWETVIAPARVSRCTCTPQQPSDRTSSRHTQPSPLDLGLGLRHLLLGAAPVVGNTGARRQVQIEGTTTVNCGSSKVPGVQLAPVFGIDRPAILGAGDLAASVVLDLGLAIAALLSGGGTAKDLPDAISEGHGEGQQVEAAIGADSGEAAGRGRASTKREGEIS